MKVLDLMSPKVIACGPDTDLARAGWLLWEGDCGALPVVQDGKVVGIVTDRDICMAAATQSRPASAIHVSEITCSKEVAVCAADDSLDDALQLLAERQIRRLPVVDSDGVLVGMLSIHDVLRAAQKLPQSNSGIPSYDKVVTALKAICEPHVAAVH